MQSCYAPLRRILPLYLGLMCLFFILLPGNCPPASVALVQGVTALAAGVTLSLGASEGMRHHLVLGALAIYQLIASGVQRALNYAFFQNPLGYHPADAAWYDGNGRTYHLRAFFERSFVDYIQNMHIDLDDQGFNYIVCAVYQFFGGEVGVNLMLLVNIAAILLGAHLLYKLACHFIPQRGAELLCLVWGVMPYAVYTTTCGLKENFLVLFVLAAMYFLYRYRARPRPHTLALFFLCAAALLLFRTAIFFMLLATFVLIPALRWRFMSKNINLWLFTAVVVAGILLSTVVDFVGAVRGGVSSDQFELSNEGYSGGTLGIVTNLLAAIIGPFPSFISSEGKENYITIYSFSPMIKLFLSGFYLYGVYTLLRVKNTALYPILIFIGLHSTMLFIAGYSLHDRYQWAQYPFVLLISVYGIYAAMQRRKAWRRLLNIYPLVALLLLMIYNLRVR